MKKARFADNNNNFRKYLRIKSLLFSLGFAVFLAVLSAQTVYSQTVSGIIADSQNAPVENAEVNLIAQKRKISTVRTDSQGKFDFGVQALPDFTLTVTAAGFAGFSESFSKDSAENLKIVLSPSGIDESVRISITQTASRLDETPASVVVLNRETLQNTAAQNIDDVLRQIPGFNLFRRSSSKTTNPTAQGANLRGVSGSGAARTAVQLDGISVNDAFGGWTYWTRIPKTAVEQIETLRGGASPIYGDSALSGAVNLRTKSFEEKPVFRFETSAGTQATFDGSLFGAAGKNGWNVAASADLFGTGGYVPTAERERGAADSKADSRYRNFYLTLEKRFSENARIFTRKNYFSEQRDNGTRLTTNQTRFRQIVAGADLTNEQAGAFQLRGFSETQLYDQTFSAVSNNRNTENLSRFQQVPSQADGAGVFWSQNFGANFLSAAFEFRRVRGFSDETIFVSNRASSLVGAGGRETTFSIFLQDFWRVSDKFNVSFGGRFDTWKNSDALSVTRNLQSGQIAANIYPDRRENAFSPRIAAIYSLNRNFSVVGAYSKSFRAPTLNELYRAFRVGNVLTLANENLRAERADNYETGLNFSGFAKKLNLRGNFFVTEIARPVVSVTLTNAPSLITRQRQNVGATLSKGLEIDGEYRPFEKFRFSAGYLLVDSRVGEFPQNPLLLEKFLPQVARQQLTFQAFYAPRPKLSFSVQSRISGAQFEDDLNTLRLKPYAAFDAFAAYKINKITIFTAIENIFDTRYDIGLTPNRTVAAPRFWRGGLRFEW